MATLLNGSIVLNKFDANFGLGGNWQPVGVAYGESANIAYVFYNQFSYYCRIVRSLLSEGTLAVVADVLTDSGGHVVPGLVRNSADGSGVWFIVTGPKLGFYSFSTGLAVYHDITGGIDLGNSARLLLHPSDANQLLVVFNNTQGRTTLTINLTTFAISQYAPASFARRCVAVDALSSIGFDVAKFGEGDGAVALLTRTCAKEGDFTEYLGFNNFANGYTNSGAVAWNFATSANLFDVCPVSVMGVEYDPDGRLYMLINGPTATERGIYRIDLAEGKVYTVWTPLAGKAGTSSGIHTMCFHPAANRMLIGGNAGQYLVIA